MSPEGDGDAPTLQSAIDSSASGDTVFANPGRFHEVIDFKGKAITVLGSGPLASIIDGSGLGTSCVAFLTHEDRRSVIEGFTITGGQGYGFLDGYPPSGGGIVCIESTPTIRKNRIIANRSSQSGQSRGYGGGVGAGGNARQPEPILIEGNEISDNEAGAQGGGVYLNKTIDAEIVQNVFFRNRAEAGDGGAIEIGAWASHLIIVDNVFQQNESGDKGGGIHLDGVTGVGESSAEITGNIFIANRAYAKDYVHWGGGGLWIGDVNAVISQNTIVGNRTDFSNLVGGGGILLYGEGAVTVERNIIAHSLGSGIACFLTSPPTVRNNLFWQNILKDFYGKCGDFLGKDGNVVADPDFCDWENGDFSLGKRSPAIEHEAGPLGAVPYSGCTGKFLQYVTWSHLKSRFGKDPTQQH